MDQICPKREIQIQHIQINLDAKFHILSRQSWFIWSNFLKKEITFIVINLSVQKYLSIMKFTYLKKFAHPFHSLKMIFENITKVRIHFDISVAVNATEVIILKWYSKKLKFVKSSQSSQVSVFCFTLLVLQMLIRIIVHVIVHHS